MATWTPRPTNGAQSQPFRIHRVKPGAGSKGVIVSYDVIGTELHFWKGRSVPCTGNTCTACQSGQQPRWKGYVQVLAAATNVVVICELTDRCVPAIDEAKRIHGSLRGLGVHIRRANARVNGPLEIEFAGTQRSDGELPDPADLIEMLERMWEQRQTALPGCETEADPAGKPMLRAV
jgi:hypothetical protein